MSTLPPKPSSPFVSDLLSSMEYGPAPEADDVARRWIADHSEGKFGHFIDNK